MAPTSLAVHGRIEGQRDLVAAVVLYGPQSILHEQARVRPGSDGSFTFATLPEGRYRVVVEGVEGRQLRCSPPARWIQVGKGPVPPLDFKVDGWLRGSLRQD